MIKHVINVKVFTKLNAHNLWKQSFINTDYKKIYQNIKKCLYVKYSLQF